MSSCSRLLHIASVLMLLAGCGFQLQGAYSFPDTVSRLYISTEDRFSPLYRELSRSLTDAGVTVIDTAEDDAAVLTIMSESTGQRVLSVSARNVPTEFEVFYILEYSLSAGGESLMLPRQLSLTRDYRWDENLVLGKLAEEESLRNALVTDIVRLMIRQIDTL